MALELTQKGEKKGYFKIYDPKQKAYAVTREFRGRKYTFFNKKRGKNFGKGLRPTFAPNGDVICDFGIDEIVAHFRAEGLTVEEYDNTGKKVNSQLPKVEPKKEDKK